MIPGQNLLNMALTVIAKQAIRYYHALGRTQNSIGQDITQYAPVKIIYGSWQPVPRHLYEQFGLDFQKDYFVLYTSNNVIDVQRDVSGDQVSFNGQRYQCESNTEWFQLDGWNGILCVHVGVDTGDRTAWGFGRNNQNFGNGNFVGQEA
jgi:hypothetical protein